MSLITTGALGSYLGTISEFKTIATDAIGKAEDSLWLMDTSVNIGEGNAKREDNLGTLGVEYDKTINGTLPKLTFTIKDPVWPNYSLTLNDVTGITVPEFTEVAPVLPAIGLPKAPNDDGSEITEPGLAPVISNIVIPDAPSIDTITDPLKYAISLPTAPTIDISEFNILPPSLGTLEQPMADFNWEEDDYSSDLLTQVVARVSEMNAGGTGIPDIIWDAIWEKDNEREAKSGVHAIQSVNKEWASRGFSLPQGVQVAQVLEVQQKIQDSFVSRARDIAIKQSSLEIENMKFAVQQGIAMESLRSNLYQQMLNRTLEGYKYTYQLSIEVLNSQISLYNAKVQAYLGEAQVHKIIIETELADLQIYKTELEGQQLVNQINIQEVEMYKSKVQAETIKIEQYNSVLSGVETEVNVAKLQLDAHKTEVQTYGERIKAIGLIYDNYKTAMSGAKIEADIYNTSVNAFGSKVQAYSSQIDAEAKRSTADININDLKIKEYITKLDAHSKETGNELARLKLHSDKFGADIIAYKLSAGEEKNRVETKLKDISESIRWEELAVRASITDANNYLRASTAGADLSQRVANSIATVEAGIAASAMSTINTSSNVVDEAFNQQVLE